MEFKMVIEAIGAEEIYSIHTIEAGEVIGSESFDNFEQCAKGLVETMLENGAEDETIEEAIVDMLRRDTEDKHTGFILDLLHQHYLYLEEMGR